MIVVAAVAVVTDNCACDGDEYMSEACTFRESETGTGTQRSLPRTLYAYACDLGGWSCRWLCAKGEGREAKGRETTNLAWSETVINLVSKMREVAKRLCPQARKPRKPGTGHRGTLQLAINSSTVPNSLLSTAD